MSLVRDNSATGSLLFHVNFRHHLPLLSLGIVAATLLASGESAIAQASLPIDATPAAQPANATAHLLFVNPHIGQDHNDGSQRSPLRTIARALQIAQPNTVILLASGTYSADNGEVFPLQLKPGITLQGDPSTNGRGILIRGGGEFLSPSASRHNATLIGVSGAMLTGVTVNNPYPNSTELWVDSGNLAAINNTFTGSRQTSITLNGGAPTLQGNQFTQEPAAIAVVPFGSLPPVDSLPAVTEMPPATAPAPVAAPTAVPIAALPATASPIASLPPVPASTRATAVAVPFGALPSQPNLIASVNPLSSAPSPSAHLDSAPNLLPAIAAPSNQGAMRPALASAASSQAATAQPAASSPAATATPAPIAPSAARRTDSNSTALPRVAAQQTTAIAASESSDPLAQRAIAPQAASPARSQSRPIPTWQPSVEPQSVQPRVESTEQLSPESFAEVTPQAPGRTATERTAVRSPLRLSPPVSRSTAQPAARSTNAAPSTSRTIPVPPPESQTQAEQSPVREVVIQARRSPVEASTTAASTSIPIPVPPPARPTASAPARSIAPRAASSPSRTTRGSAYPGTEFELLPVPSAEAPLGNIGNLATISLAQGGGGNRLIANRESRQALRYRVIVETSDRDWQQVRGIIPSAFRTVVNGRSVIQAGAYGDRANAEETVRLLNNNGFRATVQPID